jgi:site-specific DNA recombinase
MRAVIYTRVSSEEQVLGWSLEAQRTQCMKLLGDRGWQLVRVYEEPGRSAKTDLRPVFQRMMHDAELQRFDVIVVHKLDRFSRSLLDVVKNVGRLKKPRVGMVSVSETWIDTTTPMGELMVYLFAFLAEWDNENRARETAKGKEERARSGFWNRTLSFGYTTPRQLKRRLMNVNEQYETGEIDLATYERKAERIERYMERYQHLTDTDAIPHPTNALGVLQAYTWYSSTLYSDRLVAQLLNEQGYRTTGTWGERLFEADTVSYLLQNRFYLGETQYKGKSYPGRHEPIIPVVLFEKCQEVRRFRQSRSANRKSTKRVYPLSRLALCARCGYPMRGQGGSGYRYYRDPKRSIRQCSQHQIRADVAEAALIKYLSKIKLPEDWRTRILKQSLTTQSDAENIERQRASLEKQLERLKELYQLGDIERDQYMNTRNEIKVKLAALQPVQDPDVEEAAALLENMSELLKSATPEELDAIFHSLLKTVYLDGGPQGPVMAIEPQPFLKLLMDVSDVPTVPDWTTGNPNKLLKSGSNNDDDDGGGSGPQGGNGQFAQEASDDTIVPDAGKKSVVRENPTPVAPELGENRIISVLTFFITREISPITSDGTVSPALFSTIPKSPCTAIATTSLSYTKTRCTIFVINCWRASAGFSSASHSSQYRLKFWMRSAASISSS